MRECLDPTCYCNVDKEADTQEKSLNPQQDLLKLCKELLDFAEHGDYSNGVEEFGIDEGRVRAGECLTEFCKRLDVLKKQLWEETYGR